MKKLLTTLSISLLAVLAVMAQFDIEDVVYLKNGSILRGKLSQSADKVKIELAGGSLFVFDPAEIDSIKKESTYKAKVNRIKRDYLHRDRGFRNMTEFGFLYGTNLGSDANDPYGYDTRDDFGMTLHTVNGYQWWPYLYTGAGVGIDRYITYSQTFSPFYFRAASEFLKKKVTPYVFCDVGYSVMWQQKMNDYTISKNIGGLYLSAGAGIRIYTRSRASVILSAAYKRTDSQTKWHYENNENTIYNISRTYQRVAINLGVTF